MRKSLIFFIILISFPVLVAAGFNFGFIKGVKKKVDQVDEKVIQKKEELHLAGIINQTPILSWTGESNYISDGLNPETGDRNTSFIFRVKYTDSDNDAPAVGYPKVHIKKGGAEITGSPFAMGYVSGANNTGAVYSYSKILVPGSDYIYYFEAQDAYNAIATGAPLTPIGAPDVSNNAPILSWTGETNYVSDGADPESGDRNTSFIFRVKYTDSDNDAPAVGYPKVHIKKGGAEITGSPFAMTEVNAGDTVYIDGKIYTYSKVLTLIGTDYTYYFDAQDAYNAIATGAPLTPIDVPDVSNNAPILSWTGETTYASDGLNPETGQHTDTFIFRVKYTDSDNDAPLSGYPKVHIKKGGTEISGSPFAMTYVSGANNTGAIYTYSTTTLSSGTDYTYHFEAKDAYNAIANGTPLNPINAPDINNSAPTLFWTGETNYVSDGLNPEIGYSTTTFVYRVKYTDVDNDAPAADYPKVHIKKGGSEISGSPFAMTYVSGANNTGAIYTYSTTTLSGGTDYTYYFEAQDAYNAIAIGTPTSLINAPDINNVPVLSWTNEANYVSDGLNPEIGYSTMTFIYRVKYTDVDNDAPAAGYPKIHIKKGGSEISGSPFSMTYVSGANNTGVIYSYSFSNSIEGVVDYTYHFEAKDAYNAIATGNPLNSVDAPNINIGIGNWSSISAGGDHTIAIKTDGTLWSWGRNVSGQLGLGDTTNRLSPTQVGTDNNWSSIAASRNHTIAIKTDGTLWSWGWNTAGQLGLGDYTERHSPTQVGTDINWSSIVAGENHTISIKTDGTLWTWGYNHVGQLGLGDTTNRLSPTQVGTDNNWSSVSAGENYTIVIKSDGTLWAWGYNGNGELGLGDYTERHSPTQVGIDTNWSSVSGGEWHTIAIKNVGTLWAWGANGGGQLGFGDTTYRLTPTQVGTDTNWSSVSTGDLHTISIKTDGTLWAWGLNDYGQLGLGDTTNRLSPIQLGINTNWSSISGRYRYTMVIKTSGTLWSWGMNWYGQLGLGDTTDRHTPTWVP